MYVLAHIFYLWKDTYSTITYIVFNRKTNKCYKKYYYKNKRYFENVHPLEVEKYLVENFKLIYEIRSNNVNINSIYKNK